MCKILNKVRKKYLKGKELFLKEIKKERKI